MIIITIAIIIFNININIESLSSSSLSGGRLSIYFIFATHTFTFNRVCWQKFDLLTSFALLVWQVVKICAIRITHRQPRWEQPAQEFSTQCLLAISPCYGVIQQVSAAIKKHEMRSSSARPGCRGGGPGRLRSLFPRLRRATRRAWLPPHRWGHPQVWQTIRYISVLSVHWFHHNLLVTTNIEIHRARSLTTGIVVVPFQVTMSDLMMTMVWW